MTKALTVIPEREGVDLLLDILGWARPHDSETERRFCREYLDTIEGMQTDGFGNRYLRIGDTPVMWSCHVDTVGSYDGPQFLTIDRKSGMIGLAKGSKSACLGADDSAGVWIMLEMIRAKRPGLYVFHRGEERGCLGSGWIVKNNPELFDGINAAMAFDRKGYTDVITSQNCSRCCSDEFARSFGDQLNELDATFKFSPASGVYTDTAEYTSLIAECSNLSVGYFHQHSTGEELDFNFIMRIRDAMLMFDASKLVIKRDKSEADRWDSYEYGGYSHHGYGSNWGRPKTTAKFNGATEFLNFRDYCEMYPEAVATLLIHLGVMEEDIMEAIHEYEDALKPKPTEVEAENAVWCPDCGGGWLVDDPKDDMPCPKCGGKKTTSYYSEMTAVEPDEDDKEGAVVELPSTGNNALFCRGCNTRWFPSKPPTSKDKCPLKVCSSTDTFAYYAAEDRKPKPDDIEDQSPWNRDEDDGLNSTAMMDGDAETEDLSDFYNAMEKDRGKSELDHQWDDWLAQQRAQDDGVFAGGTDPDDTPSSRRAEMDARAWGQELADER